MEREGALPILVAYMDSSSHPLLADVVEEAGYKVIIGGQAFDNTGGRIVAAKVGADEYASTVAEAVELANRLVPPHQANKAA